MRISLDLGCIAGNLGFARVMVYRQEAVMRRKAVLNEDHRAAHGSVRHDLDTDQLLGVGAVAMAYNELEAFVDTIFVVITGLGEHLGLEVGTRINGVEGKVAIIKAAAKTLGMKPEDLSQFQVALGDDGFMLVKRLRDAVVHARVLNKPKAIGYKTDRKASRVEVLLS